MKFIDLLISLTPIQWALPIHPIFTGSDSSPYEVTELPGAPNLGRSWAGRIDIPETEAGNSLFFWLFDSQTEAHQDDLIIWLNGGPGCSSLVGMGTANGPWIFDGAEEPKANPFAWTSLGNVLYIDQPAGSGLSTSSSPYPVKDNERATSDLYSWLGAFYKQFPHLLWKRTHIMGESYAGIYIPYVAARIVENQHKLPINLKSISLGDGTFGNNAAMGPASIVRYMQSQQNMLNISDDILGAFSLAATTCGFDDVFNQSSYPPMGPISIPGDPEHLNSKRSLIPNHMNMRRDTEDCSIKPTTPSEILHSILSGTCYGPCATFSTVLDYFTTRATSTSTCFSIYNIGNTCATTDPDPYLEAYLNRTDVQSALHIPSHTTYTICNSTILQTVLAQAHVEPPAYRLIPALLDTYNIAVHIYEGDRDMLMNHVGIELVIQNMTWGGSQGFSHRPDRPFVQRRHHGWQLKHGTWGAERGLSYHLFMGAGHEVPKDKREAMWMFVRDFVVGDGGYQGQGAGMDE